MLTISVLQTLSGRLTRHWFRRFHGPSGIIAILALVLAIGMVAAPASVFSSDCYSDEYQEAIKQTEDEWKAFRTSMQEGNKELSELLKKYQEYEDAAFSSEPKKGVQLAKKIFNLSDAQEAEAMNKVNQLREMFNTLDKNGLKTKLESVAGKLKFADSVAGFIEGPWEYAKKFDPEHAKDNPTYGLRLIGDILTESASKMETVPLVGEVLGKWVRAYGEAAGDFANALDRLSKKIKSFRQESLCGQGGAWQQQQEAFEKAASASPDAEACQVYLATTRFTRLRGMAFEANASYFLFDPSTCNGWISKRWATEDVYEWHQHLLQRRALDAHWLASRANSLTNEIVNRARDYHQLLKGLQAKSNDGWVIIKHLHREDDVRFYAELEEVSFMANYILAVEHRRRVDELVADYEKYLFVAGTVYGLKNGEKTKVSGATVTLTGASTASGTTNQNGEYEIIFQAPLNSRYEVSVTAAGYDEYKTSSTFYERVGYNYNYTLGAEGSEFTISGMVYDTTGGTPTPVSGATVSASSSGEASLGSSVTGGDGSYLLTMQAEPNTTVSVSATLGTASGGATVVVTGDARSGVDIMLAGGGEEEAAEGNQWTITVTVIDGNGKPLPGATVSDGATNVVTGGAGTAVIGPLTVDADPYVVTISASIVAEDGVEVTGGSVSLTYEGQPTGAAMITIPVVIPTTATISGRVTDANGIPIPGAAVVGGSLSTTSAGDGGFSLGPYHLAGDTTIMVQATFAEGHNTYGGAAVPATFAAGATSASVTVVLDIESDQEVTITGRVVDANSRPLAGVVVTAGGQSATTDGSGGYTLPPFVTTLGKTVAVSATFTDDQGNTAAGQASVTPTSQNAAAPTIVLADVVTEEYYLVTVSGSVVDNSGGGVANAAVTAGGKSTSTDGSGSYSLADVEYPKNGSVSITASATNADGATASGQASVSPAGELAVSAPTITLDFGAAEDTEDDGGDDALDDIIDDLEGEGGSEADRDAALALFNGALASLQSITGDFYNYYDFFTQRVRELNEAICQNNAATYSLRQAELSADNYTLSLGGLTEAFGEVTAAFAGDEGDSRYAVAQSAYQQAVEEEASVHSMYGQMLADFNLYQCDKDQTDPDADQRAADGEEPEDIGGGGVGGGVEVCGDGIDNDGDNEIDECDAGCCNKNVQVIVSDCGNAADDIFSVAIDGIDVGLTPKGAANTFNRELEPGGHSVEITCLDDGGDPGLPDDIGTACVTVIIFGNEVIGGSGLEIALGGTATVGFTVPAGDTAPPFFRRIDGSGLQHEGN